MTVQEMHYDFKQKINKADSQQYRNLRTPEIDWWLNEAQMMFIRAICNPKQRYMLEGSPRSIDDLNTIMVDHSIPSTLFDEDNDEYVRINLENISPKFLYFVSGEAMLNINCGEGISRKVENIARLFERKHIDMFKKNEFYKSSFEWGEVNIQLRDYRDSSTTPETKQYSMYLYKNDFDIDWVRIYYLKYPYDIFSGGYNSLNGEHVATDSPIDCELPEHVHTDVVDLAVLLATGAMQLPDYQTKMNKIQMLNS